MRLSALPITLPILLASALAAGACRPQPPAPPAPAQPSYVPGLGEIMTFNQMRHTKLWFAGQAENWPLAAYELDELREGFDDAARFHPTQKGSPLPIKDLVPKMVTEPLHQLDLAIQAKDKARFDDAFDELTRACNSCHQAANFGFNVVRRPTANPFTNQVFTPAGPSETTGK
jgi:hypothetical protein